MRVKRPGGYKGGKLHQASCLPGYEAALHLDSWARCPRLCCFSFVNPWECRQWRSQSWQWTGGLGGSPGAKPESKASLSVTSRLLFPQTVEGWGPQVFLGAFSGFLPCMPCKLWVTLAQLSVYADSAAPCKRDPSLAVRGLPSAWSQFNAHIL